MIYLLNSGPGRFGNRLFSANYIFQLKEIFEADIFIGGSNDLNKHFVFNFNNKLKYDFKRIKIINKGFEINPKINYLVKPPILGDHFFKKNVDINNYLKIKSIYKSQRLVTSKTNVAIHFRGTDFSQWNPKSILSHTFYLNSIENILRTNSEVNFYLYTDDKKLNSYKLVKAYLKKRSLDYFENDLSIHFMYDFSEISQCNILISSPSTFSIMAGIFGRIKKIYHSKEWINHRIEKNDKFSIDLNDLKVCNKSKVYVI